VKQRRAQRVGRNPGCSGGRAATDLPRVNGHGRL
jgi:hypothetical protein